MPALPQTRLQTDSDHNDSRVAREPRLEQRDRGTLLEPGRGGQPAGERLDVEPNFFGGVGTKTTAGGRAASARYGLTNLQLRRERFSLRLLLMRQTTAQINPPSLRLWVVVVVVGRVAIWGYQGLKFYRKVSMLTQVTTECLSATLF